MSPNPQETSIFVQCKYVQSVVSFSNYAQVQFHYSDLADVSTDSKSNLFIFFLKVWTLIYYQSQKLFLCIK